MESTQVLFGTKDPNNPKGEHGEHRHQTSPTTLRDI